jgi:hypothetical protein
MRGAMLILAALLSVGCEAPPKAPTLQAAPAPKSVPVCAYGGQIAGDTVVCNARFTPMPSPNMWSVGKVFFDNKTARTCWGGDPNGTRGTADVSLPSCSDLQREEP